MSIDWTYPLLWGIDLKSHYRSVWLGWWLVTWSAWKWDRRFRISFQPGC